ncbi:glycosyltransferase family 4 protein [Orenia marismortui]|uniref:glycosyltransferase family 4 protein n=1 Tax=Orenia marismortui TaxID=46469 RepID=UPI0003781DE7|nr:glycosyltransferase family 4 protein [Orenia marismortui]
MKRLNILQIHSAKAFGGGEVHLYQLVRELSQRGHNLTLVIRDNLVDKFSDLNIDINPMSLKNVLDFVSLFKLVRIIKEKQIDIIHAHRGKDYWLAIMAASLANRAKVVITRHILKPLGKTYLHHHLYNKISKIIVVSNGVKRILINENNLPLDKVELIYNGVDLSEFRASKFDSSSLKEDFEIEDQDIVVGTVGRLAENKNQKFILEVASKLKAQIKDIKYLIVGEDDSSNKYYKAKLEEMVQGFNLNKQVYLTGFRKDIPALMNLIDILIVPSKEEAFGIVAIEAMAMKKPVIASKVGGLTEVIQDGKTGFLLPLKIDSFAEKIKELVNNSKLRSEMGEAGYKRVLNNYTIETMINKTEKVYYDIVDDKYQ